MTEEEALNSSIEKWERIVAGVESDEGGKNCALCHKYAGDGKDCEDCPVTRAGYRHCENSEYRVWLNYTAHYAHNGDVRRVRSHQSRQAAYAELRFLKSLLPSVRQRASNFIVASTSSGQNSFRKFLAKSIQGEPMSNSMRINRKTIQRHTCKLQELCYGTILTGVIGHPDSTYIKVDKDANQGVSVRKPRHTSALLNLKTGKLRAVDATMTVTVLQATMDVTETDNIESHKKDPAFGMAGYTGSRTVL